jgi:hypothetical protein
MSAPTAPWYWDVIRDRFKGGWFLDDDGSTLLDSESGSLDPIGYDENGAAVYAPLRQRIHDRGHLTMVCVRCRRAVWSVTRHCVEVHGDTDVEILPTLPGKERPLWLPAEDV